MSKSIKNILPEHQNTEHSGKLIINTMLNSIDAPTPILPNIEPTNKVTIIPDNHVEYIDILRVLSMFSVVFLHVAAGSLRANFGSATWHIANVLTALMSCSVPIFFMISGALLLSNSKTLSVRYTFQKRLPKMFIPFLIWSLVAVAYYVLVTKLFSGYYNRTDGESRLKHIFVEPTTIHLWFMYALIPLYMISPLIKKLVDGLNTELTKYIVALWLIFGSLIPTIIAFLPTQYRGFVNINYTFSLNFMSGFLGFFVIGYFLFISKKIFSKKLLFGISLIILSIITVGTWFETTRLGVYSEIFKTYQRIFVLILSVCIFLLLKELFVSRRLPSWGLTILKFLSPLSFGVYLVHNLFVDYFSKKVNLGPAGSVYILFKWYFIISGLSLIVTFLLASFKYTCFVFTGINYKAACKSCNLQFLLSKFSTRF